MASSTNDVNQVQTTVECDTCENTAKHLCKNCHDRLCDNCKIIHSKSKATFDHEVVLLTYEALTSESPSNHVCKWHPKFRTTVGCQNCEVPVCEKCLIGEHNGHNLMDINELFQYKENKLEQKLSIIRAEYPKYESRLDELKKRQTETIENREAVKKEIGSYFEKLNLVLKTFLEKLNRSADERAMANLTALKDQESIIQTNVKNMQEYMDNILNEDLRERIEFIYYANCAVDGTIPEVFPSFLDPGKLNFSTGMFFEKHNQALFGCVSKSTEIKLSDKEMAQLVSIVSVAKEPIITLVFCNVTESFWTFSSHTDSFMKYDKKGNLTEKISSSTMVLRNRPICMVDNADVCFYRNDPSTIFVIKKLKSELFFNVAPMVVVCLCPTRDGDILVGLLHSTDKTFAIARVNMRGERKNCLTHVMKNWISETLPNGRTLRAYMAENLSGDICLSFDSDSFTGVILICSNGDHKKTYKGEQLTTFETFLPRGICTDALGQVLIADENNHGVHVLDRNGEFLTMITISSEPQLVPISLCIDNEDNLCVGCADGKVRILKYLDY